MNRLRNLQIFIIQILNKTKCFLIIFELGKMRIKYILYHGLRIGVIDVQLVQQGSRPVWHLVHQLLHFALDVIQLLDASTDRSGSQEDKNSKSDRCSGTHFYFYFWRKRNNWLILHSNIIEKLKTFFFLPVPDSREKTDWSFPSFRSLFYTPLLGLEWCLYCKIALPKWRLHYVSSRVFWRNRFSFLNTPCSSGRDIPVDSWFFFCNGKDSKVFPVAFGSTSLYYKPAEARPIRGTPARP